jgi:hypothetical protein
MDLLRTVLQQFFGKSLTPRTDRLVIPPPFSEELAKRMMAAARNGFELILPVQAYACTGLAPQASIESCLSMTRWPPQLARGNANPFSRFLSQKPYKRGLKRYLGTTNDLALNRPVNCRRWPPRMDAFS